MDEYLSRDRKCYCEICELARADRRRAFAAGWDGVGSVAPFLVALDEREARIQQPPVLERAKEIGE